MGEYMDKYMNEWYIQYCRFILILSISKSLMAPDLRSCLLQGHGKILRPNQRVPDRVYSQHHSWTKIDPNEAERCDCWKTSQSPTSISASSYWQHTRSIPKQPERLQPSNAQRFPNFSALFQEPYSLKFSFYSQSPIYTLPLLPKESPRRIQLQTSNPFQKAITVIHRVALPRSL